MKCEACGMQIPGPSVREEVDGVVHHYCCVGCLEDAVCRRDRALRQLRYRAGAEVA